MLEGFRTLNLTIGIPSISVTINGIGFSKAAILKMGKPENVLLMIDEQGKRIAIQVCEENDEDATPFLKNKKNISVRWNNKDLLNTISKMMSWDLEQTGYKVEGEYLNDEKAMIFELEKATVLNGNEKDDE